MQTRYTPGLIEVFECLTAVRSPLPGVEKGFSGGSKQDFEAQSDNRDLGSIQKIEVPDEMIGLTFGQFFMEMAWEFEVVPIALLRGVDLHENDNKLPYLYTAPKSNAVLMDGDHAFILAQPDLNLRRRSYVASTRSEEKGATMKQRSQRRLRRESITT